MTDKKPSLNTLKTAAEFKKARNEGVKHIGPSFILQYAKGPDQHFGFIITRKIGNAVVRNLIRRRLKALVREMILEQTQNGVYIFVARMRAAEASYQTLKKDTMHALKSLGVLKNDSSSPS